MKTLLALAALLAAACASILFPDMKPTLLLVPFALLALAFTSGCSSASIQRSLRGLPEGSSAKVSFGHTNLGMGTVITAEGFDNHNDVLKAKKITATHNDPWSGQTTLTIEDAELDVATHPKVKKSAPAIPAPASLSEAAAIMADPRNAPPPQPPAIKG